VDCERLAQLVSKMKYVYVTRHFNHSGYLILKRLLQEGLRPDLVVVKDEDDPMLNRFKRPFVLANYRLQCAYYRCKPLKTTKSEELLAKSAGIDVWRVKTMKDDSFYENLKAFGPDLIVLGGGWHELVPERVFSLPPLGCINTHPSLLPAFRGTSITRWQVLHGVTKSGSTIHYVDGRFDTGGIIQQKEIEVNSDTTPQELFYNLGILAADMMPDLLRQFKSEGRVPERCVTKTSIHDAYFRRWKWDADELRINWENPLQNIHYMVKANTQENFKYLGPVCLINGREYIVRETQLICSDKSKRDADVTLKSKYGDLSWLGEALCVRRETESYSLEIRRIQKGGKYYRFSRSEAPRNALRGILDEEAIRKL
jgi:methionyl-tRNA formyltransferase